MNFQTHSYNRYLTFCKVVNEEETIVLKPLSAASIVIFAEITDEDDEPWITLETIDWPDDNINDVTFFTDEDFFDFETVNALLPGLSCIFLNTEQDLYLYCFLECVLHPYKSKHLTYELTHYTNIPLENISQSELSSLVEKNLLNKYVVLETYISRNDFIELPNFKPDIDFVIREIKKRKNLHFIHGYTG